MLEKNTAKISITSSNWIYAFELAYYMFILQNKRYILHIILILFCCLCCLSYSGRSQLVVSFVSTKSQHKESNNPIKQISYCLHCPDPENEGSVMLGLNARYGLDEYQTMGELVYSVPNHAELDMFFNEHQFQDRIVLVDRGKVPLLEKILKIQETGAGAAGVIIVDDGSCQETFSYCSSKIGSALEGGFAAYDDARAWEEVEIPVVLVTAASGAKLRALMSLQRTVITGIGDQYISAVTEPKPVVSSADVLPHRWRAEL